MAFGTEKENKDDPGRQCFDLKETESNLLNIYIQWFSRTYPTCSGPENPLLSIFIPLSMRNRAVLDTIPTLTSVQSWTNGVFEMQCPVLRLHRKAIQDCIRLVRRIICRKEEILCYLSFKTQYMASHFPLPLQPVLLMMSLPSWPAVSCFYFMRS